MNNLSQPERAIGAYRSFLVRLWQSHADGHWHASVQSIQNGATQHFTTLEELFVFLTSQCVEQPQTPARLSQHRFIPANIHIQGEFTMTHARFVYVHLQPDKIDDAIALFRHTILPATQEQTGFQGARLLVDRASAHGVIVTLWESEAAMHATEASGYLGEQLAKLGELFSAPPTRAAYELAISV